MACGASIPRNDDWHITGPYGGSATAVAIDAQHPEVLLAGARQSLLYKSDTGGNTWTMLPFPKRSFGEVGAILIDPLDSQHYIVGLVGASDGGLFESPDAGKTWTSVSSLAGLSVRALTAAPNDPSRYVAGTTQGVYLSTDSGRHWLRISDPSNLEMLGITAVAIDPKNPDIIYAGTPHLPWKTNDGGKSWNSIHTGMIDDSDVFSIFIDPRSPAQVFASACSGIYQSGNGGEMWRKMMGIPNTHRRTHVIRQDPEEPGTIYAGTTLGLFKSTDHGASWHQVNDQQVNSLVFDPEKPSAMYLALEDGGVWKSDDRGKNMAPLNTGFVARRLTAVTVVGDELLAMQTQDGDTTGFFSSGDGGATWKQRPRPVGLNGVHFSSITGVPHDPKLVFASTARLLYRSVDSGFSWKPAEISGILSSGTPVSAHSKSAARKGAPAARRVAEQSVHPNEINALIGILSGTQPVLLAATNRGILRSTDKGGRWQVAQSGYADNFDRLYVSPISDGRLVARSVAGMYFSQDFGETWKLIRFPFPSNQVTDVAIPPVGSSLAMLVATVHGLYTSKDLGETWYPAAAALSGSTVKSVMYSSRGFTAYAVLYGQLYQSTNGGATWDALPSNFRSLSIRQLWQPAELPDRLFAVTNDIGILFRDSAQIR